MKTNRREFLTRTAALAGGMVTGKVPVNTYSKNLPGAEEWNKEQGIRREDERLLNIGGVFGLWSHMSSSWWRYFNPPEGYARTTGMRISHVWCVDPVAGQRLAERYDAELVETYDGMVGKVDGMFIDDFFATPFMPDLSLPYLEAGIPCYFDRPMASSMPGARKVLDTSKRTGTPFMIASAYEYLKEVEVAHLRLKDIGAVKAYEARNSGTTTYQYALHGLWFTLKCMGVDVERIGHRTVAPTDAPGLTVLEHRRDGEIMYGTLHHARMKHIMCSLRCYGAEDNFDVTATVDGRSWFLDVYTYLEMLHAIERMIRTGRMPESHDYIEAKMRIFLTLLYSAFERNGEVLEVASLPDSFDAGFPKGFSRSYSQEVIDAYRKVLR